MAEFLLLFQDLFNAVQFLALCICLVLVGFLYRLVERERRQRTSNTQSDLANMMILFQTMRDMLRQQKELAQQLNENLDKKLAAIRQTVDRALQDLEEVREKTHRLSCDVTKTGDEVVSLQRQVAYAGEDEPPPSRESKSAPQSIFKVEQERTPDFTESPTLHVLARPPVEREDAPSHSNQWVGLDLGSAHRNENRYKVPERPPEQPGDAEAARQAFRALLNMDREEASATNKPLESTAADNSSKPTTKGNGRDSATPLQAKVYEYSDVGMTVSQISRELGIGKGEIRLILGLRSGKDH